LPTEETLTIEKLVYGGDGLARIEGRVVLVPFVLPGEVVRVEVERVKNDLFRGRLLEIVTPSPLRVPAPCPYFMRCGGCNYQHADYNTQVDQKRAILLEVLKRVGKIEYQGEVRAITGQPWAYRNRAQLHVSHGAVGYFEHASQKLCAIDRCPIASPALNQAIEKLSERVPQAETTVELFTNERDIQVNVKDRVPRSIYEQFASAGAGDPIDYSGFRVSLNSFFQVNRFMVDQLVDCAVGEQGGESAVDLYAGVGLFAMRLAAKFKRVTAVESQWSAFRDLEYNISQRSMPIEPKSDNAESYLATLEAPPDLILADPPRAGLGKQVVRELIRVRAPRLTIVSCDPATLARDLQALLAAGYRIQEIALVDLFPQTFHLETIVQLAVEPSDA